MFELLGIGPEEAEARFGFFLEALRYGAPAARRHRPRPRPHGDAPRRSAPRIRDVIAFPKTASATDLMTDAPSGVDAKQLRELGIAVPGRDRGKREKRPDEWYHGPMKTGAARRLDPESQGPTPESFLEEIRDIINSGTLRGAREVAERGLALYPDHPELQRLHHALRPFEVDGSILKATISIRAPTTSGSRRTWLPISANGSVSTRESS